MTDPFAIAKEMLDGLDDVTPGPWEVMTCNTIRAIDGDVAIPIFDTRSPWKKHRHISTVVKQEWHNARHAAKCSPDRIRTFAEAYIAERAEREALQFSFDTLSAEAGHMAGKLQRTEAALTAAEARVKELEAELGRA